MNLLLITMITIAFLSRSPSTVDLSLRCLSGSVVIVATFTAAHCVRSLGWIAVSEVVATKLGHSMHGLSLLGTLLPEEC